jgi:hypothetical protein
MADNSPNGFSAKEAVAAEGKGARRRSPVPLAILAALFVIVPFLAWYGTWFGRALSDEEIGEYLSDETKPRHVQHALSQIAERMDKRDESVKKWYPQILKLAESPVAELRLLVAWLMGKDNSSEEFHAALLRLIGDQEPIVRRNAALSLVTFGDASGRAELRAMLQPYTVVVPFEGTVASVLPAGSQLAVGSLLARLKDANGQLQELRSPLPGKINQVLAPEGTQVKAGEPLLSLAPDSNSVWEALRALYLVGQREDLAEIEKYSRGVEGLSERIKEQAALTAKAIESRSKNLDAAGSANQPSRAEHPAK